MTITTEVTSTPSPLSTAAPPSTPTLARNDYENPWESAANDRLWEHTTTTTSDITTALTTSRMDTSTLALLNGESNHFSRNTGFGFKCFQACHVLDIVGGCGLALYSGLVWLKQDKLPSVLLITLACLIILRGILAKITRHGVGISATLSFGLTGLYVGMAVLTYGVHIMGGKDCKYIPFDNVCHTLTLAQLALICFVSATFECIRYLWIRQWMFEESTQVRDDLNASEVTYRRRRHEQPWWWQSPSRSRHTSTEPLLNEGRPHWSSSDSRGYHMEHGVGEQPPSSSTSPTRSSWWPFSRWQSLDGGRDDGSVEYASLNEDWASRSQEDPFWWTREEGGRETR